MSTINEARIDALKCPRWMESLILMASLILMRMLHMTMMLPVSVKKLQLIMAKCWIEKKKKRIVTTRIRLLIPICRVSVVLALS